jgi:hypothetical protein
MFTKSFAQYAYDAFAAAGYPLKRFPEIDTLSTDNDTLDIGDFYILAVPETVTQTIGVYTRYKYEVWEWVEGVEWGGVPQRYDQRLSFDIDNFSDALITALLEYKRWELNQVVLSVPFNSDEVLEDIPF